MAEFLEDAFRKAIGWSTLLGLPTPNLSYIPITEAHGPVELKKYERFYHIAHGLLASFCIYSRQNRDYITKNGPKILNMDNITAEKIKYLATLKYPNELARLVLEDSVNVNNFDVMLSKLTG